MKVNPKISVVMAVYNGEKYVSEAIESILNQTYKDFEFIIINDGSKDNTFELIEKYQNQDQRIKLVSRENNGLVQSLNEGIKMANGDYIARMDADDICLPTRFEEQLSYMDFNKLDLCGSWVQTFNSQSELAILEYPEKHNDIEFRSFFMCSFAHPSVMIKRSIFDKIKYKNETAEDYRLWCDILSNGYKAGNIQRVLLKYRIHNAQLTQIRTEELINSENNISLDFSKRINPQIMHVVVESIDIKNNCTVLKFNKLINNISTLSKEKCVSKQNLSFIFKVLYENSSPKNPFIYYLYYKYAKNKDKKIADEYKLFLKSFLIFSRNSKVYQFLKRFSVNEK